MPFKTSAAGRDLIKKWEGVEDGDPSTVNLDPYLCPAGYWTIAWGHVVRDHDGNMLRDPAMKRQAHAVYPAGITYAEAETLLSADLIAREGSLNKLIGLDVHQWEFDAMMALMFNIGLGNFQASSVLKFHHQGLHEAPDNDPARLHAIVYSKGAATNAPDAFLLWNKFTKPDGTKVVSDGLVSRRLDERKMYLG